MKFDEIDKILADKLKDFEFDTSAVPTWEEFNVHATVKKRKRYTLRSITWAATAAAACLTATLLFLEPVTQSSINEIILPELLSNIPSQNSPEIIHNTDNKDKQNSLPTYKPSNTQTFLAENTPSTKSDIKIQTKTIKEPEPETDIDNPMEIVEAPKHIAQEQPKKDQNKTNNHYYQLYDYDTDSDSDIKKSKKPLLAMSAYTSLSKVNSNVGSSNIPTTSDASVNLGVANLNKGEFYQMGDYIDFVSLSPDDFNHKFPIIFGLNLDIELTKGLSLTTGVSYSYLESNATIHNRTFTYKYKQSINYLGVPIGISYKFLRSKLVDLYATAGVGIDFAIAKEGVMEAYRNSSFVSSQNIPVESEVVQFSTFIGAGININITPVVSFYLEPTIGHYFKGDDSPITYRTQSPLRFNLTTGFKFKF